MSETQPPVHYEITVEGILDPRWSAWFDGMQLTSDAAGRTTIARPVADQAALHGLLARIRDLGLPPLALRRTEPPEPVATQAAASDPSQPSRPGGVNERDHP